MKKDNKNQLAKVENSYLPTNIELKQLIEKLLVRFENWKIEAEINPNPHSVHVLKNIVALVDSLTTITEAKMQYSYKNLSRQMAILVDKVAKLNMAITDSLMNDDMIDESEQKKINQALLSVGLAAGDLINIVMQTFGERKSSS